MLGAFHRMDSLNANWMPSLVLAAPVWAQLLPLAPGNLPALGAYVYLPCTRHTAEHPVHMSSLCLLKVLCKVAKLRETEVQNRQLPCVKSHCHATLR